MIITKPDVGYATYKTWIPMTEDIWKNDSTGQHVVSGVEPRIRTMRARNVEHTESGVTKTISDWWTFPNWRRNAHTFTYAPTEWDFIHEPYSSLSGWDSRQAMCNLSEWKGAAEGVGITDRNFIYTANLGAPTGGDEQLQAIMAFCPIAGGEADDDGKTTNHSAFTDSWISSGTYRKHFHLGNNDWFMYGDNINTFTFNDYKAKPKNFQNSTYTPYFCRFPSQCIYGGGLISGTTDTDHWAYFPEFFMIWSTDQSVNPSCFKVGVAGFRSDTAWNMQGTRPSDARQMRLMIGFKESTCTQGSVVTCQYMNDSTSQWALSRNFGNDDYGSKVVNLGECNGRYYYLAHISMNGAASRTGTETWGGNLHLLGGKISGFERSQFSYYYYTMPILYAEVWKDQTAAELPHFTPTNLPYPINVRIHNFGLGFWGGGYSSLSQIWGVLNSYDGWLIKSFGGTEPLRPT